MHKTILMDAFIEDLDFIYDNELIYRAMIICCESDKHNIRELLEKKDHTVFVLNSIESDFDYEKMDARVIIVSSHNFKNFITHLDNKYGLCNVSYNLLAFSYSIDDNVSTELKQWYREKNNNDIIII